VGSRLAAPGGDQQWQGVGGIAGRLRRAREAGIADTTIAATAGISKVRVEQLRGGGQ